MRWVRAELTSELGEREGIQGKSEKPCGITDTVQARFLTLLVTAGQRWSQQPRCQHFSHRKVDIRNQQVSWWDRIAGICAVKKKKIRFKEGRRSDEIAFQGSGGCRSKDNSAVLQAGRRADAKPSYQDILRDMLKIHDGSQGARSRGLNVTSCLHSVCTLGVGLRKRLSWGDGRVRDIATDGECKALVRPFTQVIASTATLLGLED